MGGLVMKFLLQKTTAPIAGLIVVLAVFASSANAQKSRTQDAARHSEAASKVFTEIMNVAEQAIPKSLLDKAEAIAVFPGVVKAAFIFGGKGGQGVISRRIRGGWSGPAFFKIGGGSFGAQIGAQKTDYVLLIMNEAGIKGLLGDKFEVGGEVSVAAGPYGREAA